MNHWLTALFIVNSLFLSVAQAQQIKSSASPKEIKHFLKEQSADKIVFSSTHEDIYQLRNKKTQKWGMYDWYNQLIPMEYDTIIPFKQFQPFTIAQKEGNYVIIQWPYDTQELVTITLDNFDKVSIITNTNFSNSGSQYILIASQNGSWGCVNWKDLSVIIPFKYASSEELPLEVF